MDIELAGGAVTYEPNDDQLGTINIELAAFDGTIGYGQLPVPDPTAAISVATGRSCQVNEITTRLIDGFVIDYDRSRGPQPAASAIVQTFSVADPNAMLDGFRIAHTAGAGSDYDRVLEFVALEAEFSGWDTTWVLETDPVEMPEKRYKSDGGWTSELIPDLVEATGKTLFVHDKASGGVCLHYHHLTEGHFSGLQITDVPGDVNGTTHFAPGSPLASPTSIDLRNNIRGEDQQDRVAFATDATSIATHDVDGLRHEALVTFEAASQADLQAKTDAYLLSFKDDYVTYSCEIGPLDATALALIRAGDIINVTSTVMGLSGSLQRIAHMRLKVWTGKTGKPAPGLWAAELEMGGPIRRRARGRGAKKPPVVEDDCPPEQVFARPGSGDPDPDPPAYTGRPYGPVVFAEGDGIEDTFLIPVPVSVNSAAFYVDGILVTPASFDQNHVTFSTPPNDGATITFWTGRIPCQDVSGFFLACEASAQPAGTAYQLLFLGANAPAIPPFAGYSFEDGFGVSSMEASRGQGDVASPEVMYTESRTIAEWNLPDGTTHVRIRGQLVINPGTGDLDAAVPGEDDVSVQWRLSSTTWDSDVDSAEDGWDPTGTTISASSGTVNSGPDPGPFPANYPGVATIDTILTAAPGPYQLHLSYLGTELPIYQTEGMPDPGEVVIIGFVDDVTGDDNPYLDQHIAVLFIEDGAPLLTALIGCTSEP